MVGNRSNNGRLHLRVGELVQVRTPDEILATLDEQGRLEALPFMPEMMKHAGKSFRVFKSAHKTCDTIEFQGARKLNDVVHLEGVRCDGEFHGNCQAGCLMFWKEAWLKRADPHQKVEDSVNHSSDSTHSNGSGGRGSATESIRKLPPQSTVSAEGENVYSCQATELNRASTFLPWWDFRQYIKDVTTGNVTVFQILGALQFRLFRKLLRIGGYRALIWTYDTVQKRIGGSPFPFKYGTCSKTPVETLNLQPGENVQVKSQNEILKTVNSRNRNRGLSFDEEMVEFCGGTYPVLRRVQRIVNEKTGKMMNLPGDCIILEGVTCQSRYKDKRLFCPRSIYPYWREIWLKKVNNQAERVASD